MYLLSLVVGLIAGSVAGLDAKFGVAVHERASTEMVGERVSVENVVEHYELGPGVEIEDFGSELGYEDGSDVAGADES